MSAPLKSEPVNIRFPAPLLVRMRMVARENGISLSDVVRLATRKGLEDIDQGQPLIHGMGSGES